MDMHVHRIGRTGRAGDKDGIAYTLITHKEARFAGELVNSLIATGQNVSMELMDLAMKLLDSMYMYCNYEVTFALSINRMGDSGPSMMWKERQRKGGGGGGGSGSGSGRGVRGVDYGLGIGYNAESSNASSQAVQSRNTAVNSLKTGMMAQFRSNFVAASSLSKSRLL
ncbi:hypothetical protein CRYUN_Cryun01aG0196700 [Craigia yunnanensis]